MKGRREILLGFVAGAAGLGLLSRRAFAWYLEEMTPAQQAAFAAACRAAPADGAENHTALISAARQDLLQRIAKGLLPAGSSEQVGCPFCGCSFAVTADGVN